MPGRFEHDEPDLRELGFRVRSLAEAEERLTEKVEENTADIRAAQNAILAIQTKSGMMWTFFSILGGAAVHLGMKLLHL